MLDFTNTKWDVRDWTREQKIQFQEKCFELGYTWAGYGVQHLNATGYFLNSYNRGIIYTRSKDPVGEFSDHKECFWADMFPEDKSTKGD